MDLRILTSLLPALSALLPAQNVSMSVTALTSVGYTTAAGTQTIGPGPLPASGSLNSPGSALGSLYWSTSVSLTTAELLLGFSGSGATTIGPGEFLVTIASTGPASLPLRFEGFWEQLDLAGFLQFDIDVGNDGTVDWQLNQSPTFAGAVPDLAVQPLQLRFVVGYAQVSPANFHTRFRLRAMRDGIYAFPLATNCGVYHDYNVSPLFDTSVADLSIRSQYLSWHVVGLAPTPALLPPALTLTTQPCLLVPSPDLVLRTGTLYLAVPQAVRPIVLHTQLVDFAPAGGLRVSNAYQVTLL